MTSSLAFVGDVHGNLNALQGLLEQLAKSGVDHAIFLGDYINKGLESAAVLQQLMELEYAGRATLLAGNHEEALLHALDSGDLGPFLKMGGAMTIRSYLGRPVGAKVLPALRAGLPVEHIHALRRMPKRYEASDVIAQHVAPSVPTLKFAISAHVPVGKKPRITRDSAHLDTGCGGEGGRLTALLWPSREYLQVDQAGQLVTNGEANSI